MFGLKHIPTNKIVTVYSTENDKRDFCVSRSYYLSTEENLAPWTTNDRDIAEFVRNNPGINWARASEIRPSHSFQAEDLEIIYL